MCLLRSRYFMSESHDIYCVKHDKIGGAAFMAVLWDDKGVVPQWRVIIWLSTSAGVQHHVIPMFPHMKAREKWKVKDILQVCARAGEGAWCAV